MSRNTFDVTQTHLKSIFCYEPDTGNFIWLVNRKGRNGNVGDIAGTKSEHGYTLLHVGGKTRFAHRMAWLYMFGEIPPLIDHINGNKKDNRIENLRAATSSQNIHHQGLKPKNTTGAKGLLRRKNNRAGFHARITVKGQYYGLGVHDTKDEAAHAYNKAAIALLGEFAVLNPIGEDYEPL